MAVSYRYDAMNRLTNEERHGTGERYAYDLYGNRLKKQDYHYTLTAERTPESVIDDEESYCYNERNQLIKRISAGSLTTYSYDKNGSIISEEEEERVPLRPAEPPDLRKDSGWERAGELLRRGRAACRVI